MNELDPREEVIFNAARQFANAEKLRQYLDLACEGEPEMRQRIERMLGTAPEADSFFGRNAAFAKNVFAPAARLASVQASPGVDEQAGTVIGRYKLLEKIGEGGMGVVYMAQQEEPVRRRVAFKIIKLGMDTKQVVARFEAERQALALMDHPNIARVLDVGATDTGRPYFVMELVQGVPITEFCDKNRLPTEERIRLFIPVCQAIQSAHQKGIIHRDLKPTNILVGLSPDGLGIPKVIDFGVAKATNQKLTEKTLFTHYGMMIGTPAYMSPEQAEMSHLDIDTRTDIYGLGVLLYELLTGTTPFPEQRLRSAGYNEIQRIILEEEPEPPSTRLSTLQGDQRSVVARNRGASELTLGRVFPRDLDWIVMKCLEKDRARRYETANGLARDIERCLQNEPVVARPPSRLYEFQKTVRRHWVSFAAVTAVLSAFAIGMVVSALEAARARRAESLAKERLAESETISRFLSEVFQSPDPARVGRTVTVAESLDATEKKLETDLANQPAIRARLQTALAWAYHALGLNFQAVPLQEKVRDYYLAAFGLGHTNTMSALYRLAIYYDEVGRADAALKLREQVLALRQEVSGPQDPDTLAVMSGLAHSYHQAGRNEEALKLCEKLLAVEQKVNGLEHPSTLAAESSLANVYEDVGRANEALKLHQQVLAQLTKIRGPEHPDTLWAMNNLAVSYYHAGRTNEALRLREQVLALRMKVNGPEHPDTLAAMINLAGSEDEVGRHDEALKLREQAVVLRRKVSGPEHLETVWAMNDLGISYIEVGRLEDALKVNQQVLALRRKLLGPEHPDTLTSLNAIAWIRAASDAPELRNGTDAVNLAETAVAATHRTNAPFLDTLAAAYAEVSQFDKAVAVQQEAIGLLHTAEEKADYGTRLKLYQANKPCRMGGSP
jgi:eukaryotic-like serine/threonine-protein kinase